MPHVQICSRSLATLAAALTLTACFAAVPPLPASTYTPEQLNSLAHDAPGPGATPIESDAVGEAPAAPAPAAAAAHAPPPVSSGGETASNASPAPASAPASSSPAPASSSAAHPAHAAHPARSTAHHAH